MPLSPGTTLGPYEIQAPLGAGGMGEVYKARDTRLDRTVAIKVLPEHVASDPDLKQRFEREAKTISSLNHPHICTLHDIGSQDGIDFLVMEYLEGETLAQRLQKGALPLDQALQVAIEIADALDKAHRQGITHRDLKPGNIMLTKAGAKLLDFGLAKLKAPEQAGGLSALPTQEAPLTEQGTILGTFQYMAPEQLEGKEADARTDIFAFGTTVYEMVTGSKAFEGKSQASLIGAIMTADPVPLAALQPTSPRPLGRVVHTCLEKDPNRRWQSVSDVGRQLLWCTEEDPALGDRDPRAGNGPSESGRRVGLGVVAAACLVATVVGVGLGSWVDRPADFISPGPARFNVVALPSSDLLLRHRVVLSPDGEDLVYTARQGSARQLYRRSRSTGIAEPISGTAYATEAFFSPDGRWVGFEANGMLRKISLDGGLPEIICPLPTRIVGAVWDTDGTITYGLRGSGLVQVSADGGDPRVLTTPVSGDQTHRTPSLLPDGQGILFTVWSGSSDTAQVAVLPRGAGEPRELLNGSDARFVSTGHLLFARGSSLWAVPFDIGALSPSADASPILDDVLVDNLGGVNFDVAADGTLAYLPGSARDRQILIVDRAGAVLESLAFESVQGAADPGAPRVSPDGHAIVFPMIDDQLARPDIWMHDLAGGQTVRLTSDPALDQTAVWSADGQSVYFVSDRAGGVTNIFEKSVSNQGPERLVYRSEFVKHLSHASTDGRFLMFDVHTAGQQDLWTLSLGDGGTAEPFVETGADEDDGQFSPNGRWIAYSSNSAGRYEVFVTPFQREGRTVQVSSEGGKQPKWRADGNELFYVAPNGQLMSHAVNTTEDGFGYVPAESLFQTSISDPEGGGSTWDTAPDGARFYVTVNATEEKMVRIVLNWFDELQRLVPTP